MKDRRVRSFQSSHAAHDYKPLLKNVLDAIKPIYNDFSKYSLLETRVGEFMYISKIIMSLNHLIWKINPKIMSSGAITVELAAYIAAALFNEGSHSLLFFLKSIGVNLDHNAHTYAEKTDAARILLADKRAAERTRDGRLLCRQQQIAFLESVTSAEKLLYVSGVDDST